MFPHSGSVQQGSHQESGNHAFFSQNSGRHWDKVPSFLISPTRLSSGIREPCLLVGTKFWMTLGQGSLFPDQFRWVPSFLISSARILSGIREPCLFVCLFVCLFKWRNPGQAECSLLPGTYFRWWERRLREFIHKSPKRTLRGVPSFLIRKLVIFSKCQKNPQIFIS